jgi:hypothetical protein
MMHSFRHVRHRLLAGAIFSILHVGLAQAQSPEPPGYPGAAPEPAPPPLSTGGLTPPPTSARPAGETATLSRLERAEREDAGRGLEFVWLNVESGYQYVALQALRADSLVDGQVVADRGSAFALGVGAGLRLIFFTLGARFRLAQQSAWDLWTLSGELGLHFPLGVLEPYFSLSAGYASLGSLSPQNTAAELALSQVDASGFDARLGAGLDWYINPLLSIGAQGSAEVLVLSRKGRPLTTAEGLGAEPAGVYARDGDGIGIALALTGVVGLHF